ncbi:MAG TPA: FtsX-like permease family protein [Chitinophagaceae bacterium]|nr:FtsX-like permease family protein [Chitinophagaceae bacterium]
MIKNFCKVAWRNIVKNKTFSIINITGLLFSVSFCLLLFFYIRHEQSYDTFHTKKDRLFRLEMSNTFPSIDTNKKSSFFSFLSKGDDENNQLVFPEVVAANMQQTFPEIKNIVRFKDQGEESVKVNNQVYSEKHVLKADSNFFNSFSFPIIAGNAATALQSTTNIVISKSLALKYFGQVNAIGKTIEIITDTTQLFTVSAVAADAPENSSIQYTVIVPLRSDPGYEDQLKGGFNSANLLYVVELSQNTDWKKFEVKMNKWVVDYYTKPFVAAYGKYYTNYDFKNFRWSMRPLADCHYNISRPWGHYTDAKNIYQLSCIVLIILLIACLNYILLVISNAATRSQEVGVRKVLGASRWKVIIQFWTETQLVVFIAIILGLVLTAILLPVFNNMMGTHISLFEFSWKEILLSLAVLALSLGLVAGYYPALLISKMKPVSIIKSFRTFKINPRFSKIMVIAQYGVCVVLMFAAFVMNRQMHFISNKDLGFDKEQVLMVKNPTWDVDFTQRTRERLRVFAASNPAIIAMSGMNGGLDGSYNTNGFMLNGEQKWLRQLSVDYNYFEMLGLKFVQGRPFSRAILSDTSRTEMPSIVNETLFKMLGSNAKIGVYNKDIRSTIIGVVKDYNFESLSRKIEPEQHTLATRYQQYFMFKVRPGKMQSTIASLQKEWRKINNDYPFDYTFLDQSIAKVYDADMRWRNIMQASCFFAIFIACLGLFGLSAVNAANRTKEIGIRKVLGATVKDIVQDLSRGFVVTFMIAIVIAAPLAYWIMNNWLQNFAYRINLSWWAFLLVGFTALAIALITVSFKAIRAATANPVNSLRSE